MAKPNETVLKALGLNTDFEKAWAFFEQNWLNLDDHFDIVEEGIERQQIAFEDQMRSLFRGKFAPNLRPVNVPSHLLGPVRPENIDAIAEAWTENRMKGIRPTQFSLALVLAHAVFESLMMDLAESAIRVAPPSYFGRRYGGKTVTLQEALATSPTEVVRGKLLASCRKGMTLLELIGLVTSICSSINTEEAARLMAAYRIDETGIQKIDERRQGILHRIEIDPKYDARADMKSLRKAARCYAHLFANCLEDQQIAGLEVGLELKRKPPKSGQVVVEILIKEERPSLKRKP
ncbi:MAG: hypothetical protein AAB074_02210 [Planctomycetota bacterium]